MSKLAEVRKKKCLSQDDLFAVSGVSRSVIRKYESGERDINKASGETLLKLATALQCRMEDILEREKDIVEDVLFNIYKDWRKSIEDENEWQEEHGGSHPIYGSVDCRKEYVREDFSNYAGLPEEINFEEMLVMEKRYEQYKKSNRK